MPERRILRRAPETFLPGDGSQAPSQGGVCFVVLGWYGLLFQRVTNSKTSLGRVRENDLFLDGVGQGAIILMEALVTKITFEVPFKKVSFQNTEIGVVHLTKRFCLPLPVGLPVPG